MMFRIIVITDVLAAAFAQMLLQKGALVKWETVLRQYLNGWVIGGYGIMAAAMIMNIFAISNGVAVKEVSVIESLSYLFVPSLSLLFFNRKLKRKQVLAIGIIVLGVLVFFI